MNQLRWSLWQLGLAACLFSVFQIFPAPVTEPVITRITAQAEGVRIEVAVPPGLKKVTLESRSRLMAGTWTPRAVERLDGSGGVVIFELAPSSALEILRVRADEDEAAPASFFDGVSTFSSASGGEFDGLDPLAPAPFAEGERAAEDGSGREVVESDIWRWRGDTLYFFNQYRGLQVIDLSDPASPALEGTLELPASGEQMYVLERGEVVLLARQFCYWGGAGSESSVIVVGTGEEELEPLASIPVHGYIQESRMVGSVLYIVSQMYRPFDDGQSWEWGSMLESVDLSDPATPVLRERRWVPGYGNVIYATDRFLFVATADPANWWQSNIRCFDISSPDGGLEDYATLRPSGRVLDKFKMQLSGEVFTVITEHRTPARFDPVTVLENFIFSEAAPPARSGRITLADGERLFATRFDGRKVYIVTFFQIDPLWVVDLSDPADPRILGELEVPGWSTFIHPMGDRLVTVGIDDTAGWKVAVSLFDVEDPGQPALLDKLSLGEGYSWSEANHDEKAFNVLEEAGLILLPFQSSTPQGAISQVQLIDLDRDTLRLRGVIDHAVPPRRATLHRDHIVSVSGHELVTVDASDRDQPRVEAKLDLAWRVDQLFLHGDYLLGVANGTGWGSAQFPSIRVLTRSDSNHLVHTQELEHLAPIAGAAVKGDRLYLAQVNTTWTPLEEADQIVGQEGVSTMILSVFSLEGLPELRLVAQAEQALEPLFDYQLEAVWPSDEVLVWSSRGGGGWFMPMRGFLDVAWWPVFWGGGGGRLIAWQAGREQARFLSDITVEGSSWGFSRAQAQDGLVYISSQQSFFLEPHDQDDAHPDEDAVPPPDETAPSEANGETSAGEAPAFREPELRILPIFPWVYRHYLHVVDYADPIHPTARRPVNIPGRLESVGKEGMLLYTVGHHWEVEPSRDGAQYVHASAYDGVAAYLVDAVKLPSTWPVTVRVWEDQVYLGRPGEDGTGELETWRLTATGTFEQTGSLSLELPVQEMVKVNDLIAARTDRTLQLIDGFNPGELVLSGSQELPGCLWVDLWGGDGSVGQGFWLPLGDYGVFHAAP